MLTKKRYNSHERGEGKVVNIVLLEPQIPGNTGNIGRTCVATNSPLHLIKPLGFDLSEKAVRRSGLDYWHRLDLKVYENLEDFFEKNPPDNLWLLTTKAEQCHSDVSYGENPFLIFGREDAGLPEEFRRTYPERCIRIPMQGTERSLNLSNAASIVCYEALRQQDYPFLPKKKNKTLQISVEITKPIKFSAHIRCANQKGTKSL